LLWPGQKAERLERTHWLRQALYPDGRVGFVAKNGARPLVGVETDEDGSITITGSISELIFLV